MWSCSSQLRCSDAEKDQQAQRRLEAHLVEVGMADWRAFVDYVVVLDYLSLGGLCGGAAGAPLGGLCGGSGLLQCGGACSMHGAGLGGQRPLSLLGLLEAGASGLPCGGGRGCLQGGIGGITGELLSESIRNLDIPKLLSLADSSGAVNG